MLMHSFKKSIGGASTTECCTDSACIKNFSFSFVETIVIENICDGSTGKP